MSRLKPILNDSDLPGSIVELIQISENEKEQFAYISTVLLRHLTGMFSLNSKEYSTNLFSKLKVQSPTLEAMGMGETTTWHGAPDGCCDLLPVIDATSKENNQDDQDSDASSGGKTTIGNSRTEPSNRACVMSFIHANRHPAQNALIPALGISGGSG